MSLINYKLVLEGNSRLLKRIDRRKGAYIRFHFRSLHVLEELFKTSIEESLAGIQIPRKQRKAAFSGICTLVFKIPRGIDVLDYSIDSLLQCINEFKLMISPVVTQYDSLDLAGPRLKPQDPTRSTTGTESYIELPKGLFLSPTSGGICRNSVTPVSYDDDAVTEYYHLSIMPKEDVGASWQNPALFRAVWFTDGYSKNRPPPRNKNIGGFESPFKKGNYFDLVVVTGDASVGNDAPSRVIEGSPFMLTCVGAIASLRYKYNKPSPPPAQLDGWQYTCYTGRDMLNMFEFRGTLYPFNIPAKYIRRTEREYLLADDRKLICSYLYERHFIEVTDTVHISTAKGEEKRSSPLLQYTVNPHSTEIDPPNLEILSDNEMKVFLPRRHSVPCKFSIVANDFDGNRIKFSCPLVFVAEEVIDQAHLRRIKQFYEDHPDSINKIGLAGQKVALTERNDKADAEYDVKIIRYTAEVKNSTLHPFRSYYYPFMSSAEVEIPAVKNLISEDKKCIIRYFDKYLKDGFRNSMTDVFAILDERVGMKFPVEKGGGIATGLLDSIGGLSLTKGPVGGDIDSIKELVEGKFDPAKFFGDSAKLLGDIKLVDVIEKLTNVTSDSKSVPNITTKRILSDDNTPIGIQSTLEWRPQLVRNGVILKANETSKLEIVANTINMFDGSEQKYNVDGSITDIEIQLFSIMKISFSEVSFHSSNKEKFNLSPKISDVELLGQFSFVKDFFDNIPGLGGAGLNVDIRNGAVVAELMVAIPPFQVGIMGVNGISVTIGAELPLDGRAMRFLFCFAKPSDPFRIFCYFVQGTGDFCMTLTPKGLESLQLCLAVGLYAGFDIGVLSGYASIRIGIAYTLEEEEGEQTSALTAFIEVSAGFDLAGIVSVSVTFYLSLTFKTHPRSLTGTATVTICISILCFTKEFSATVTRTIQDPDPTKVEDIQPREMWNRYAKAFA